jgi:hypothetical protein
MEKKLVVFVASERDQSGKYSPILDIVERTENVILLHNQYDYTNEKGREMLSNFETEPPVVSHPWEASMRQDFWGISESDILVLDLDSSPNVHFMAVAAVYGKPMLAVSSTLTSVPPYFSGVVDLVVKPEDLISGMGFVFQRRIERVEAQKLAEKKATESEAKDDQELRDSIRNPNNNTKDKMQDILNRSMKKTLSKLDIPVESSGH